MAHRWTNKLTAEDVTPYEVFMNRRQLIAGAGAGLGVGLLGAGPAAARADAWDLTPNTWEEITSYNNFYEFGSDKGDPAKYAHEMTTEPRSLEINGMVDKPGTYDFKDIMSSLTPEERLLPRSIV